MSILIFYGKNRDEITSEIVFSFFEEFFEPRDEYKITLEELHQFYRVYMHIFQIDHELYLRKSKFFSQIKKFLNQKILEEKLPDQKKIWSTVKVKRDTRMFFLNLGPKKQIEDIFLVIKKYDFKVRTPEISNPLCFFKDNFKPIYENNEV